MLATDHDDSGITGASEALRVFAVDRLVDEIRETMTNRGLRLGNPVPTERDLGEMFRASRNTVRAALVVQRAYGLIETRPKFGAVAAALRARDRVAYAYLCEPPSGVWPALCRWRWGPAKLTATCALDGDHRLSTGPVHEDGPSGHSGYGQIVRRRASGSQLQQTAEGDGAGPDHRRHLWGRHFSAAQGASRAPLWR